MRNQIGFALVLALITPAWAQEAASPAAPAAPAAARAADGDIAEEQATTDLLVAQVRLSLVKARKALKAEQYDDAVSYARTAQVAMKKLPKELDLSVYQLQAEGILARVEKLGQRNQPLTAGSVPPQGTGAGQSSGSTQSGGATQATTLAPGEIRVIEVTPAQPSQADASKPERVAQSPKAQAKHDDDDDDDADDDDNGQDDVAPAEYDRNRLPEQMSTRDAIRDSDLNVLMRSDEARIAPDADMAYPPDWREITGKRRAMRDGAIYRSPGHVGKDGKEWHMAIYDLSELSYVPPDFSSPTQFNVVDAYESAAYRDALRQRSEIFNGFAEDLAMGLPLLRFFGSAGIDPMVLRGPKYSREKTQQIVEMIRTMSDRSEEPKVIVLPYVNP